MSQATQNALRVNRRTASYRKWKRVLRNWQLYVFLIPTILYFLIFRYYPMYGLQIAFRNYKASKGIWGSQWVGLRNFQRFFATADFWQLLENTLAISVGNLIISFPVPIILALLLNQMPSKRYKKIVQTVIYAPHFISTVVMVGIIFLFFSPSSGIINHLIVAFGGQPIHFMAEASMFRPLYIGSEIWQGAGWGSILYLAALASINPELHEAAVVDGANKLQRVWHIDIPGILPTVVIMFILNSGKVMAVGFEKAYLMQTSLNISTSEIIATYVYKRGLLNSQFSFSATVGMFESVVNLVLIVTVNFISRKVSDSSLF
ncbi:MAG: sugar ABC transporter permease [Clostridiales bacterium]|nr:sugar ABC transporter permease [Clostridiales bacterium]